MQSKSNNIELFGFTFGETELLNDKVVSFPVFNPVENPEAYPIISLNFDVKGIIRFGLYFVLG